MKTWRSIQLGNTTCDQDNIILELFQGIPVRYIGNDLEFSDLLLLDNSSRDIVAVFNSEGWISNLIDLLHELSDSNSFYLGINRYALLGNDTNLKFDSTNLTGLNLINLVERVLPNFKIIKSGFFDNDEGRYFNFVQPLTWVYATNNSNKR